jgi:hypothetical protein
MRKLIFVLLVSLLVNNAKANVLSDSLRISLLTVAPGNELYSTFGHTAIRLTDLKNGYDIVFNYGTFDFNTDWFYLKFALGQLDYLLTIQKFENFMESNIEEKRSVTEQLLSIPRVNKAIMVTLLLENYQPQNRSYRYKFFTDNCATRVRDVLAFAFLDKETLRKPKIAADSSFRTLFTSYLTKMPWSCFGIELVLGKMTDNKAGYDAMFLPDILKLTLSQASEFEEHKVVAEEEVIYKGENAEIKNSWFTPVIMALLVLISTIVIQFFPSGSHIFDRVYFLVFGLLGLFITSLSVLSHHQELNWNFVILLFLPTNIYLTFVKSQKNMAKYAAVAFSLTTLALLASPILPQKFNTTVFLLGIATAIRLFFNFVPLKLKSVLVFNKTKQ